MMGVGSNCQNKIWT